MEATAAKLPKGSKERGMLYDITSKMQGIVSVIAPYKESEIIRAEQRDWLPTSSPFYDGNSGFVAVQQQWAINDGKTPEGARFQTEMPVAGRGGSLAKPRISNNRHMINGKNNSQSISTQNTSNTKGVGRQNESSNLFTYLGISQQHTKYYHHTEYNNKSAISDGVFVTDPIGMERHKPITAPQGKSVFKSDVDAEKLTLDAARYATNHNLWKDGKAKVYVNGIVGYVNGNPTKVINVYKGKPNKDGLSPIHASPGKER